VYNFYLQKLLSLLYPSFCIKCEVLIPQGHVFCLNCDQKIQTIVSSYLPLTKNKSLKVFAISDYKDPIRPLVIRKFYSNMFASRQLAQLIFEKTEIKDMQFDFIVPIPLHWTRYTSRGFNQSYVMAKGLSKKIKVPVLNILKRKRRTMFQWKLPYEQRQENVKDAFELKLRYKMLKKDFLKDKRILLIDDLCTTGATLKSAGRLLIDHGPQSISAVVACRVV
jgi:competence protein ComFC